MGCRAQLSWLDYGDDVIAFTRGEGFLCIVNFGPQPLELPTGADVLVGSAELAGGTLPQDTTVWLVQAPDRAASGPEPTRTQHSSQ